MNRHDNIPPLNPSSTRFQIPCAYGGASESGKRAVVQPSHRSLLPPLSPYSQNFSLSQSMSQPSPVSFRDSPSAPHGVSLPPIPLARGSCGSGLPPKAHRRAKSDNICGLNSLIAQNSPRLIYPKPVVMPVGVESQREKKDELLDDVSAVSNTTSGVKRRAGKEIAPPSTSRNGKSPKLPPLPPSPGILRRTKSKSVGGGVLTDSEIMAIVGSGKLKGVAASDPKHVRRILANRKSAARSKEKRAAYVAELECKLETLKTETIAMSAECNHLERVKMVLENENKELRIRLEGIEKHAQLHDALNEQLNGELHRLKLATGEVSQNLSGSDRSKMQPVDANMFQQLNINQPQTYPYFE